MLKFKIYQNLNKIFILAFFLFFTLQFVFWFQSEKFKPDVYLVPPLANINLIKAVSLGDEQFYFRFLALRIENAGDTFGRFSPLKDYDYSKLYQWFKLLDKLDNQSIYIPTLAANYYSQTQKHENSRYMAQYLEEFASRDVEKYWWWLFQAFYIVNNTLKDEQLALKLAYKLSDNKNQQAPEWTKQLPAIIYAKIGEDCQAFLFINKILQDSESGIRKAESKEMDFMRHFIKQRLQALKSKNFDPKKCKN